MAVRATSSVALRNCAFASSYFTGSIRRSHFTLFTPKIGWVRVTATGIDMNLL